MRLHGPRQEKRTLHRQILHAILHHRELERDDARHLDCPTKGNFSVALREVQVSDAELGAFDMDGQVHLAPSTQVLDVAVTAVLRPPRDGPRSLLADLGLDLVGRAAGVHVLWLGRLGDDALEGRGADEFGFALVPRLEDFLRRGAAEDAGMDQARKADVRDVARGAEDALEVPNRLRAISGTRHFVIWAFLRICNAHGMAFELTR